MNKHLLLKIGILETVGIEAVATWLSFVLANP
jgi:hypothetical protein